MSRASSSNKALYDWYNELGDKYPQADLIVNTQEFKWRDEFLKPYLLDWRGVALDLGCNEGHYKQYIKNYVGLDIALACLKRYKGNRVCGCIQRLPFKDASFDHILMSETLEHVKEHQQVLNECSRVLKKQGELLITVPYGPDPWREMDFPVLKRYGLKRTTVLHGGFDVSYLRKLFMEAGLYLESGDRFTPMRVYAYGFKR